MTLDIKKPLRTVKSNIPVRLRHAYGDPSIDGPSTLIATFGGSKDTGPTAIPVTEAGRALFNMTESSPSGHAYWNIRKGDQVIENVPEITGVNVSYLYDKKTKEVCPLSAGLSVSTLQDWVRKEPNRFILRTFHDEFEIV